MNSKSIFLNPWTHVDILIFIKLDKEPVLVAEVDGHEYHKIDIIAFEGKNTL